MEKKKVYEDQAGEGSPTLADISNKSREINRATGFEKQNKKNRNKNQAKTTTTAKKKQFYELYDETRKSSPTFRKFSSKSREVDPGVDRISNIKNNSMELRLKQEKRSPPWRGLHESHIFFSNFIEFV